MNKDYFENIDSPEKAYCLGVIYADGCVYKRTDRPTGFRVELKMKDLDVIKYVHKQLNLKGKIYTYTDGYKLATSCTKMGQDLINLGCVPRKTFIIEKPKIDDEFIYPFLLGIIDGDGSLSLDRNTIRIFSASIKFVEWIQEWLIENGYNPQKVNFTDSDNTYTVTLGRREEVQRFINETYNKYEFGMARKKEIAMNILEK